jgi:hypothetical protein
MRSGRRRSRIAAVSDVVRLSLELNLADPLSGRLTDQQSRTRDFQGWLGLYSAIAGARREGLVAEERLSEQPSTTAPPPDAA